MVLIPLLLLLQHNIHKNNIKGRCIICGIAGFIGKSVNPKFTYNLSKRIFKLLEYRGVHAAGIYAIDEDNNTYFKKEPIPSSEFVKTDYFNSIKNINMKLCLLHTRNATAGCGDPHDNTNNHPFISKDNSKILIHNGVVEKTEYNILKEFFPTESNCDSEILLRFLENSQESTVKSFSKLTGLIPKSQFAISLCEVEKNKIKLYLYRNHARPLYFFDLTQTIGQIFFCSTVEIFLHALSYYSKSDQIMEECSFYKVSPYKLCEFSLSDNIINKKFYSIKLHKEVSLEY